MRFDEYGEYRPHLTGSCTDCGLCSAACPFVAGNGNEDDLGHTLFGEIPGIRHTPETGYYLDSFVGYAGDPDVRWKSASGGLLTWTLTALLEKQWIDYAVCVTPSSGSDKLFEFTVCETAEGIRKCARSCYYPVELSRVVTEILSREGRYAVVGLPCALKALRKAEQGNPRLKRRIAFHLGLVCGQQKSKLFAEYCCSLGGGNPQDLRSVSFRVKDAARPASDFGLGFACAPRVNSEPDGVVYWTEGMKEAWCEGWFKLNACSYCDDLFAEVAEAAYMDAWLPQYSRDPHGTNLVLVRDASLLELLHAGQTSHEIHLEPIAIDDLILSQHGALRAKRETLADRLAFARHRGVPTPQKRVEIPARLSLRTKLELRSEQARVQVSKRAFSLQKAVGRGLWAFRLWMAIRLSPWRGLHWTLRRGSAIKRRIVALESRHGIK